MANQKEVAIWMYQELMRKGSLSQEQVRLNIIIQFDGKYTQGSRLTIGLLREFRRLAKGRAVWDSYNQTWWLQSEITTFDNKLES